jgi:hypothetical protein
MTAITVPSPAATAEPRGAAWAAQAALWALGSLRLAHRRAGAPAAAAAAAASTANERASRQREAAAVRRLADSWRLQDPRFAADLQAAADRHDA